MKLKSLTKYIIASALLAGICMFLYRMASDGISHTKTSFAMNTYTSVTAYGTNAAAAAENAAAAVSEVERHFSAYIDESEVSRLNSSAAKDTPIHVSDALFDILQTAYEYSEATSGLFDVTIKPVTDLWNISENPRVPSDCEIAEALTHVGYKNMALDKENKTVTFLLDNMQIDLGGIAKGYAADIAAESMVNSGCRKALINLGGNVCVIGSNTTQFENFMSNKFGFSANKPWTVGIQTPFAPSGSYCAAVSVTCNNSAQNIVTSGAYERNFTQDGIMYHHIFDPRTGYPYDGEADSVTIIGARSAEADALSTSAYMLPVKEALNLAKNRGYDAIIIGKDKKIHTTLDKRCVNITDTQYSFAD